MQNPFEFVQSVRERYKLVTKPGGMIAIIDAKTNEMLEYDTDTEIHREALTLLRHRHIRHDVSCTLNRILKEFTDEYTNDVKRYLELEMDDLAWHGPGQFVEATE